MPVAKPTNLPRWADTVPANRVEPTSGKKDVGWVPGEKPPAQYKNWLLYTIYQWCVWLNDITNQALIWAANHSFNEGASFSRTSANTNAVTATGNGTGRGITSTGGGASGDGGRFVGGAPNGKAVVAVGTGAGVGLDATGGATNAAGVVGTGTGTATGIGGTGGATSGPGVTGTGGAPNGVGVSGTGTGTGAGGAFAGGATNGAGVRGTGTGTGSGIEGVGGPSDGIGVKGVGGAMNGIGVRAEGTGTGAALSALGGGNSAALLAKTASANDTVTAPAMVLDALDSGNRHRFHIDQLGMPGGRISHVHESWPYERVFLGNAGGELVPTSLIWYHDTTGGNKGSVSIGTPLAFMLDATSDQGVRSARVGFTGDAGEYSQLFSSQQVAAKANCLYVWEYETFFDDYVASDNEFRVGLIDPGNNYTTGHADHNPTSNDRLMLVARTSVNSGKFQVEWEKGGMADAAVDAGVSPSGFMRIRIEVVTSGIASADRTTIYINGAKVYTKAAVLDIPVGFSASIEGKVAAGGGTITVSPIDIYAARVAAGSTPL